MFGIAACVAGKLKSNVPSRWHMVQRLRTAGYVVFQNPSVGDRSCQVKWTVRFSAPWMLCTKSFWFADQPLEVRFGRWQKLQLAASLRWPAWKSGPTPSDTWQAAHFCVATIWRRCAKRGVPLGSLSSATFQTSSAGTMSPPVPAWPFGFGVYGYLGRFVCVRGCVWLMKLSVGSACEAPSAYVYPMPPVSIEAFAGMTTQVSRIV